MKTTKIVIAISDSYCANFIRGQASFLQQKGYDVIIVSANGPEVKQLAESEGVRLVVIPFSREISIIQDFKSLFLIIKFLKNEKPLLVNAGNPKTGFLFMLASIFYPKIPMIFTLRGLRSDTLVGIKKKIVFFTEWISCKLAKKVIVISPSLKEHAIKIGVLEKNKGVVLGKGSSNGIDVKKFELTEVNKVRGYQLRESLKIEKDDIVICYVGRITKDKGIEELYEAFKICDKENKGNLKLILVGPVEKDDPVPQEIMQEIEKSSKIFLLGKRNNIEEIYAASDLFVLYSYREGFGNVALEAGSMGLPTIVSNIPGAKDTIENKKSGLLVEPKNSVKLAEAIQYYIDNPDIRIIHGNYGAKRARDYFSSEIIWNGQYELYRELINE